MLSINNLTVSVAKKKILDDFSLNIENGEIHVIMGKNGIGKSTLCRVLLHDQNYQVDGGTITYNNKNILGLPTYEIAREKIMLISQNPPAIEGVTNAEVLRTALREIKNENINIFAFNKEMEEACRKLDLDPKFIHKEINVGASGGERKKVELLHMALLKPSLLILDELDSGLDVDALKIVSKFINDYHKESGCSILMITHHPNIIDYIKPNYVHILSGGKIIKSGDHHLAYEIEKEGFGANIIDSKGENE